MKKQTFRIVKNDLGYYPQVRKFFVWHKIAKHTDGYGLYPASDIGHPKTFGECEMIIEDYREYARLNLKLSVVKIVIQ